MYGLLYKELLLNKKQLLGVLAVAVLFSAVLFIPPEDGIAGMDEVFLILNLIIITCIFLVVGMMQQGIFECDERRKWQFYIASTPDGIKNQVMAKYIFTLLSSVLTVTYCSFIHTLACAVMGTEYSLPNILLILMVPTQLTLRSIEFPFLVRFGSKYGNTFRAVIIMLISFAAIVYGLFGDLSIFGSLESFLNFVNKYIVSEEGFSEGFLNLTRLSPAISLIVYYISYRISCSLYMKGGENYDR